LYQFSFHSIKVSLAEKTSDSHCLVGMFILGGMLWYQNSSPTQSNNVE